MKLQPQVLHLDKEVHLRTYLEQRHLLQHLPLASLLHCLALPLLPLGQGLEAPLPVQGLVLLEVGLDLGALLPLLLQQDLVRQTRQGYLDNLQAQALVLLEDLEVHLVDRLQGVCLEGVEECSRGWEANLPKTRLKPMSLAQCQPLEVQLPLKLTCLATRALVHLAVLVDQVHFQAVDSVEVVPMWHPLVLVWPSHRVQVVLEHHLVLEELQALGVRQRLEAPLALDQHLHSEEGQHLEEGPHFRTSLDPLKTLGEEVVDLLVLRLVPPQPLEVWLKEAVLPLHLAVCHKGVVGLVDLEQLVEGEEGLEELVQDLDKLQVQVEIRHSLDTEAEYKKLLHL